jgi:titin
VVIGNTCIGSPFGGISVVAATRYGVIARNNRIGGPTPAERNWVAANGKYGEEGFPIGVQIDVEDADGTIVEGNYVGTTQDGSADHPTQRGPVGISVRASRGTVVRNNLVSGILQVGTTHYQGQRFGVAIEVEGVSEDTVIVGNLVGTDALAQKAIPNVNGVVVSPFTAHDLPVRTQVGGLAPGEGNTVAFNERIGVRVDSLVNSVAIRGNRIFGNGDLGIDLIAGNGAGVTPNDPDDPDSDGGNHLQNFPVLDLAMPLGLSMRIGGALDSTPGETFALDFFASPTADPSGFGEGAIYLGSIEVTTSATGDAPFTAILPQSAPAGWFVSATATRESLGETSEFSRVITISRPRALPAAALQHP